MVELLTTKEAALILGVTYIRINQLIKSGELVAEKKGRDYLIKSVDLKVLKKKPERRGRPRSANPSEAALEMRRKRRKMKVDNKRRVFESLKK